MNALPPPVFEDEGFIAFEKPAGLLVAPDRWDNNSNNLMQIVRKLTFPACSNIHGLDREASGLVLCAKTKAAHKTVSGWLESGRITIEYAAIIRGTPPADKSGTIDLPLEPDPYWPGRVRTAASHGTHSKTRFAVIERWRGFALLNIIPVTHLAHQIRVHLASIGAPVVADAMYGDGFGLALSEIKPKYKQKAVPEKPLLSSLALHLRKLSFDHPVTGKLVVIDSSLPEKFDIALKYLRRFA